MAIKFFLFLTIVLAGIAIHQEKKVFLQRMFGIQVASLLVFIVAKDDFATIAHIIFKVLLMANMSYALITERHSAGFYVCMPVFFSILYSVIGFPFAFFFDAFCGVSILAFIYQMIKDSKVHNLSLLIIVVSQACMKVLTFINKM